MTTLLAFDTATEVLAVGVLHRGRRLLHTEPGGALASKSLLPRVRALLAEAGAAFADVDAIGFGRGPGAFTGLRTSVAAAQGLALGLGRPLLPLCSLLVVAEDARAQLGADALDVAVAMDARMGEAYAGRWRFAAGAWQVLDEPALVAPEALAWAPPPQCVAGSGLAAFGERLPAAPAALRIGVEADRAGALLRLAEAAWHAGARVDAADALPTYLRDKVALTTAEREARTEAAR